MSTTAQAAKSHAATDAFGFPTSQPVTSQINKPAAKSSTSDPTNLIDF
jgi:hypothetical protein